MKRRPIILISAVLFVFFGLFVGKTSVSAYAPREAAPIHSPRNQTLYIAGLQYEASSNLQPAQRQPGLAKQGQLFANLRNPVRIQPADQ